MTERPPLLAFADLLYRHEYSLAQRSERMSRFLASGSIDLAVARCLIEDEAKTNPYAQFHAARFLDLLRALAAVCDGLGVASPRVLDCGIGPITRIYGKVISGIRLQTASLPRRLPAEETARRFGSSYHRFIVSQVRRSRLRVPWPGDAGMAGRMGRGRVRRSH
jgi:hypothetical protein